MKLTLRRFRSETLPKKWPKQKSFWDLKEFKKRLRRLWHTISHCISPHKLGMCTNPMVCWGHPLKNNAWNQTLKVSLSTTCDIFMCNRVDRFWLWFVFIPHFDSTNTHWFACKAKIAHCVTQATSNMQTLSWFSKKAFEFQHNLDKTCCHFLLYNQMRGCLYTVCLQRKHLSCAWVVLCLANKK